MNRIKKGFFLVLAFYLVTGCALWKAPLSFMKPAGNPLDVLSGDWAKADENTLELIQLTQQSDAWRGQAKTAYHKYDRYHQSHKGEIAKRDMADIQRLANQYVDEIWYPLWDLMLSPYFFMDLTRDVQFQMDRESYIESGVVRYVDSMGDVVEYEEDPVDGTLNQKVRVNVYHINPSDRKGQIFLRNFEVSMGAALVLIDNFEIGWDPYLKNKAIRRILLYDTAGPKDEAQQAIQEIWRNYRNFRNSEKLVAAFNLYQKARKIQINTSGTASGSRSHPLAGFIENSPTFKKLVEHPGSESLLKRLFARVKVFFRMQGDRLGLVQVQTSHIFGKAFGLSADLFQSRKGHLKQMSSAKYSQLVGTVKPLDVLLQRSRSRLTDKFIPGHYGHVGIWVGTEEELRDLGVWDQLPGLYQNAKEEYGYQGSSFQEMVRSGKNLIEALAPGVQLHAMQNFLDADDLAVLRPKPCGLSEPRSVPCLTDEKKREYLVNAFSQIGKKYDFSLNFNTDSELVCSEVAYWTFVDFDIQTDRALGKHYVRPDQIAKMADDPNDPFYPVLLYVNGNRMDKEGESLRRELKFVLSDSPSKEDKPVKMLEKVTRLQ